MNRFSERVRELVDGGWRRAAERKRTELLMRITLPTDVALFGAGSLGRDVRHRIDGRLRPVAFVDNNPELRGTTIEGLRVLSPADAVATLADDCLWLITVYTNSLVIQQCRDLHVPCATCAELSWVCGGPDFAGLEFGEPERLLEDKDSIVRAANLWADDESCAEFEAQLRWRLTLDYSMFGPPRPPAETYFEDDIATPLADEVFVDCGAFTGDTIGAFLAARHGRFRSIVAIEPDTVNVSILRERIAAWKRAGVEPIFLAQAAAGSRLETLLFDTTGTVCSRVGSGRDSVQVVPLDEILGGREPTFIKFDVEGAEREALLGASEVLARNMPVLAVCAYHKPHDLWDLPLVIHSLAPEYSLYLRRYSDERWETVCYAVPPARTNR